MIRNLLFLAGLIVLVQLLATGCQSSELFDPAVTTGRIAGELTILGPFNRDLDLSIGAARNGRFESIEQAPLGRLLSTADAGLTGRTVNYDFTGLPVGTYNIVLYAADADETREYYRSPAIKLTYAAPEQTGHSVEISLTGPAPWGTISGTLLLSGVRPENTDMLLSVTAANDDTFRYDFNVWNANYGAMYFVGGGLALGTYGVGLSDSTGAQQLGNFDGLATITEQEPNAEGITIWGEFPVQTTTETSHSISGQVRLTGSPPAGVHLALIAQAEGQPDLGISPIFHLQPDHLGDNYRTGFHLSPLEAGSYTLAIYALRFETGDYQEIGRMQNALPLDDENRSYSNLEIWGDVNHIR